jgi:MOSC domain-containing protein YiiM
MDVEPSVVSVSRDSRHRFSKPPVDSIRLIEGFGVEGDVHAGETTQHRYLKRKTPGAPNLTQVHLIPSELFAELAPAGFAVAAGDLGENVTTAGIDLRLLPLGTRLHLGDRAVVRITGLRSPCTLINKLQAGLMKAVLSRDEAGHLVQKAGVMAVVEVGGEFGAGEPIAVELPEGEHLALPLV